MTARRRARVMLAGGVAVVLAAVIWIVVARGSDSVGAPSATASTETTPGATAPSAGPEASPETSPESDAGADTRTDAAEPYCGPSRYVEEITVQRWADGGFRVSVRPTPEARRAEDKDEAAAEMWQAARRCVEGLDGEVGDSLEDQLRCHEYLALVPDPDGGDLYATGETFDLESWRPTPGAARWISTRCGNTLGTDPTSPPAQTYRPDGVPPQYTTSGEHG